MKAYKLFYLFLTFTAANCFSQTRHTIDSLHQQLNNARTDSARVWALHDLSFNYRYSNTDSAMWYAQSSLGLSKKVGYLRGEIRSMNDLGNVLQYRGNFIAALQVLLDALKKSESLNDLQMQATCIGNIANVYILQGDYLQANKYTYAGLNIDISNHDTLYQIIDYENLCDGYLKNDQPDSALFYGNKAYELNLLLKNINRMGEILTSLGNTHAKLGHDKIALSYFEEGVGILTSVEDYNHLSEVYQGISEIYKRAGNKDSALIYVNYAYLAAQKTSFPTGMLKAASMLVSIYESLNNDSTLKYLKLSVALKDSIFNQAKNKQIQDLTFTEKLRKDEIESKKAKADEERKLNIQYTIMAISIISFITIFLLLSRSIIVNEKWISFFGVLGLLIVFEFINLVIHPYLASITHESPLWMLLALVAIASLLIPLHHKLEIFVKGKLIDRHREIRLKEAKKTIEELDKKVEE